MHEVLAGAARLAAGPLGMGGEIAPAPVEIGSAIHGIYWLSANLADQEPLLLAVDDLHWADTPSLLVLTYLARRVTELPIVICATTRPPENEPAGRYLTALSEEPTEVLQPGPLSDAGVAEVVSDIFSAQLRARVLRSKRAGVRRKPFPPRGSTDGAPARGDRAVG